MNQHCTTLLTIYFGDKWELWVKALWGEKFGEEGCEKSLVKFIVNLASINALGHQGCQGIPRHFLRWKVCATLKEVDHVLSALHYITSTTLDLHSHPHITIIIYVHI